MSLFYKIPIVNPRVIKINFFCETHNRGKIWAMKKAKSTQFFIQLSQLCLAIFIFFYSLSPKTAVLIKDKQWQKNMVLNVVFLDGSSDLHQLVRQTAPEWLQNTSLSFQFFDQLNQAPTQTHIRISFKLHSGSTLGDHQDYVSKTPTMNLFDLTSKHISDSRAQRLILHEFGHALGFEHEYRSRYWPYGERVIKQVTANCYPKMELIGYSPQLAVTHCKDINATINSSLAYLTAYDENSIMNYPISFEQKDGSNKQIKAAVSLSILDRYAMERWYGR